MKLHPWPRRLLDVLLPPACAGCGRHLPAPGGPGRGQEEGGSRVCPGCLARLRPPPHPRCGRCHAPRGTGLPADRPCPECSDWPPALRAARSAVVLVPPADALVHALKYGGWPRLAGVLAARMARVPLPVRGLPADAPLVPVPTTPARRRSRGYNQAELLARELGRRRGGPVVRALSRREGSASQIALHPGERRANVHGAFSLRAEAVERIGARTLLLVDDVLTTGATAAAAAERLEGAGVEGVVLLTFARALPAERQLSEFTRGDRHA